MTLDCVSSSLSEMWEPTLVNLAHALRKLKYVQLSIYLISAMNLLYLKDSATFSWSTIVFVAYI